MLSHIFRSTPSKITPLSTRIAQRSMQSLADQIKSKERVEEDRYMRAQEEAWKEKLRELKAMEEHEREEALHSAVVNPVMADVEAMLKTTGDSVSKDGLELLAKWKIDV
mmetsp:Transcript_72687/g.119798  ORF Transcript_72687/g.119798 Transcript_72687/m.119798 type:complete len:109 (+) Transcript_72687:52-378(+)